MCEYQLQILDKNEFSLNFLWVKTENLFLIYEIEKLQIPLKKIKTLFRASILKIIYQKQYSIAKADRKRR